MKKTLKDQKGEIVARRLQGRMTLERYDGNYWIIAFRGSKEIFFVEFSKLAKIIDECKDIIKIKGGDK